MTEEDVLKFALFGPSQHLCPFPMAPRISWDVFSQAWSASHTFMLRGVLCKAAWAQEAEPGAARGLVSVGRTDSFGCGSAGEERAANSTV